MLSKSSSSPEHAGLVQISAGGEQLIFWR